MKTKANVEGSVLSEQFREAQRFYQSQNIVMKILR
ncbi:Uncharacterised protein [Bartonella grahamii]|uniref:Uncharacterized protein n=1 Tax=Bartonella grahamii TaxID=33045 RepID=A0A336NBE9_BARGR|nr:Uncharacterised protein [Bartonella grahamii]